MQIFAVSPLCGPHLPCVIQVKDYDAALDVELDSVDKFVIQCLAFYQVY